MNSQRKQMFLSPEASPNYSLIGLAGSRNRLATPALVVDLEAMERNIARVASLSRERDVSIRPHVKTHKCSEIARRQLAAGAVGLCCAKLGEAEAMADAGIEHLLITSPIVTPMALSRLLDLNDRIAALMVVVDNPSNVTDLEAIAKTHSKPIKLLVDLDVGLHRTGIKPGAQAIALALQIVQAENLEFAGLQAYAGHLMHLETAEERRAKSHEALSLMAGVRDALRGEGVECPILTGGGTGTVECDPQAGILTDIQVGSYVFMDRQYNDIEFEATPFETSLCVQMSVISANAPGLATTDAGFKSFATDAGAPQLMDGVPAGASYFFFGDEQGGIALPEGARLMPGDRVSAVVPHCDPTVNLYDFLHVVRGDQLVGIWPIEARGKSA